MRHPPGAAGAAKAQPQGMPAAQGGNPPPRR